MILYYYVIIPVFIATLVYFLPNKFSRGIAWGMQLILFAMSIDNFIRVKNEGVIVHYLGGWENGIGIALRADVEASVFLVMTTFLFLITITISIFKKYMERTFIFLFIILEALIITMFLTADLFNIYIAIEVSTIVVSILIMYKKDSSSVYDALIYFLTNIFGMAFFLFGVAFLYKIFGVLDIYLIAEKMKEIENPSTVVIPFALLMTAASLKCAILPLFSWLPKAHGTASAPSIVSAILSGLYVKSGIYLFIRIRNMFDPAIDANRYFLVIGAITAIAGVILALMQKDIKLILSYHTVSQVGIIMVGLCANSTYAYYGALYHCLNHAIFKSSLFIVAGMIIERYGVRSVMEIRGVFKRLPVISVSALMAIAGITGTPFFNGSISKYMIQSGLENRFAQYAMLLVNFGTILSFCKFSTMFLGKGTVRERIGLKNELPVLLMSSLCFVLGIKGELFLNLFFGFAADIITSSYFSKVIVFAVSVVGAIIVYKKILAKRMHRYRILEFELTFNKIALSIVLFFVATLIVGMT